MRTRKNEKMYLGVKNANPLKIKEPFAGEEHGGTSSNMGISPGDDAQGMEGPYLSLNAPLAADVTRVLG
jgi:hypothetical protein